MIDNPFQVNPTYLALMGVALVLEIVLPLAFALTARQKLGVSWRYFWYGALIFTLFQLLSRVPLVTLVQSVFGQQLTASTTVQFVWIVALAVSAGVFEEVGRYIGYRWLIKDRNWANGVMYGLGHGGIESIVLVGGLVAIGLINMLLLPSIAGTLPADQQQVIAQQIAGVNTQPVWLPLLGAYERIWTILCHVGFSVLVLQVFQRKHIGWLWLAIVAHALLDAITLIQLSGLDTTASLLISEGWITLWGIGAIWLIWRLRDTPTQQTERTIPQPVAD